jgi:hypothetical protein
MSFCLNNYFNFSHFISNMCKKYTLLFLFIVVVSSIKAQVVDYYLYKAELIPEIKNRNLGIKNKKTYNQFKKLSKYNEVSDFTLFSAAKLAVKYNDLDSAIGYLFRIRSRCANPEEYITMNKGFQKSIVTRIIEDPFLRKLESHMPDKWGLLLKQLSTPAKDNKFNYNPELVNLINKMEDDDQLYRGDMKFFTFTEKSKEQNKLLYLMQKKVDSVNYCRLDSIISNIGWPNRCMVGRTTGLELVLLHNRKSHHLYLGKIMENHIKYGISCGIIDHVRRDILLRKKPTEIPLYGIFFHPTDSLNIEMSKFEIKYFSRVINYAYNAKYKLLYNYTGNLSKEDAYKQYEKRMLSLIKYWGEASKKGKKLFSSDFNYTYNQSISNYSIYLRLEEM